VSPTPAQQRNIRATAFALAGIAALFVALFVRQFMGAGELDRNWLREHGALLFDTPRAFEMPQLLDQDGRELEASAFLDSWDVLFFGYTFCPDVCPTTMVMLGKVDAALAPAGDGLRPVHFWFVSLDPERDTPEQLASYVAHFSPRFTGITGQMEALARFAQQLNVPFRKALQEDGGYSIDHGAGLVLLNPRGHYAGVVTPPLERQRLVELLEALRRRPG